MYLAVRRGARELCDPRAMRNFMRNWCGHLNTRIHAREMAQKAQEKWCPETQWSSYVPHSGHYMYRTVVTVCTAHWSLYALNRGHYMYRTGVTICTAQWSLYVPHSGHYMY